MPNHDLIVKPKPILISVDVETDGPAPGLFSMVELGAVVVEPSLGNGFHSLLKPISDTFDQKALDISGRTRAETLSFPDAARTMNDFAVWLESMPGTPVFVSDNPFDWMFVCWYLWRVTGRCPFGHSGRNLADLAKGMERDMNISMSDLRDAPLDHNALEDAKSNARILINLFADGLKAPT